jgi:hypothetical protein
MSAGRCPECDAPLATLADHAAWREAGEPDDYRPDLCWARPDLVPVVHSGEFTLQCMREPVDWRERAIALERALAVASERLASARAVAVWAADYCTRAKVMQPAQRLDSLVLILDGVEP